MSASLAELRKLPIAERIQLVQDLWDSIATEASPEVPLLPGQRQALRERLVAHDKDPATAIPWETVRRRLVDP